MRRRPYGPCAWLVDEIADPAGWAMALTRRAVAGVEEIVPGQDSVLVRCGRAHHVIVGTQLDDVTATARPDDTGDVVVVEVAYDGADLDAVAETVGLSADAVAEIHLGGTYRVEFCGFSPGFAYLTGLDARLHLPRRSEPRTSVPSGSVAIAAGYTSVYPSSSPGGWHLIGTSPTAVWDVGRSEPALLRPGRTVRFERITTVRRGESSLRAGRQPVDDAVRAEPMLGGAAMRVVEPGWATTVQDRGRSGWAHLGVPTAGAVDRVGAALVNRMVGNTVDAAVLETLGGVTVEAIRPIVVARSTDASRHTLGAGDRLRIDPAPGDVWAYLAIRGGVDVVPVLGSRSRDSLSDLGPQPPATGALLPIGSDPRTDLPADHAPVRRTARPIRVWPGPHVDPSRGSEAFTVEALVSQHWTVSADVSRVGVRLDGGAIDVSATGHEHLGSFGLVEGAIQVTPDGQPIVMLANHPTTGGYPVVGVVDPDDLSRVAQTRPGTAIRFVGA